MNVDYRQALVRLKGRTGLGILFLLSGFLCWLISPGQTTQSMSLDKMIPTGHQLVPITVANPSALNSVLEDHGIVDLYLGNRRAARGIKIVRGPNNPEEFSVLVPEANVPDILAATTPYRVVLRNRSVSGTRIEVKQKFVQPKVPIAIENVAGDAL